MSDDIKKHVRTYIVVFAILMGLTVLTVGVSYLDLSVKASIILALIIACVKGSLVAGTFMHLISEKKAIYVLLVVTIIFFVSLLLLPLAGYHDDINPVLN